MLPNSSKKRMLNSEIQTKEAEKPSGKSAKKDPASFLCVRCGGTRLAGDGAGSLVRSDPEVAKSVLSASDLKRLRATWICPRRGEEVVTLCTGSKCRRVLVPTEDQLARMEALQLKDVKEEAELRACI